MKYFPIAILFALVVVLGFSAYKQVEAATNSQPSLVALFETSLASGISSSATSFTLTSATDKAGTTLASSTYPFIIDENTASEEMVLADCTGTACTNVTRGISVVSGTTTVAALQHSHRRGASVKITDGPYLNIISRILNGIGTFTNIIKYTSHPTFSATTDIIDKKYVDDTAFSGAGVIDATAAARGVVELATTLETASSTSQGSSGILVIPATNATSTYNSATAALRVVVTGNGGKIDNNFISTSTSSGILGSAASSTVLTQNSSGAPIWSAPDWRLLLATTTSTNMQCATTTPTSTATQLQYVMYSPGFTSADDPSMTFNTDTGVNYTYRIAVNNATPGTVTSVGVGDSLIRMSTVSTTSPSFWKADIWNVAAQTKPVRFIGMQNSAGVGAPVFVEGAGVWNNTSSQITSIVMCGRLKNQFNSGTQIFIYGSSV